MDVLGPKLFESRVEIVHGNRQVADAGRFQFLVKAITFGWNDLEHAAIRSFDEIIAVVFEVDAKAEMLNVPVSQFLRLRRRNRSMLQAFEHRLSLANVCGASSAEFGV